MKYNCNCCNYSTDDKGHFDRHNSSKRHILKHAKMVTKLPANYPNVISAEITKLAENQTKFCCKFCNQIFAYKSGLSRHKIKCQNNIIKKQEKELNNNIEKKEKEFNKILIDKDKKITEIILESKDKEIFLLKQTLVDKEKQIFDKEKQISELKYVLKTSGILKKPTFSSLTFIINNYETAPSLLPIENYQFIKSNTEDKDFIEILINRFENGNLAKYLGNILVKTYKKEDCSKQSLWNTDSNRLTYIIKELMNDKSKWSIDKKGIKTSSNIIHPLLNYLATILQIYIRDLSTEVPNDFRNSEKILKKMEHACNIKKQIDEKILANEILKYISPFFYFDKKDELVLE